MSRGAKFVKYHDYNANQRRQWMEGGKFVGLPPKMAAKSTKNGGKRTRT
jgi:hypothetical protein